MKPSWAAHCSSFWVPSRLDIDVAVNLHSLASDRVWLKICLYDMYRDNCSCNFTACYHWLFYVNFKHLAPVTQLISLKILLTLPWLCEPFHICSACWWAQVSLDLHTWLKMEACDVLNVQQWYMHCNPQFQLGMFATKLWYWLHF
jgi:hypothetical protein